MLREDQIDIRRQRAKTGKFTIENTGKNRVLSDYLVTNPESKGQYTVAIRGLKVGDNTCTCPDYKSNTLGTCKHIEAVLDQIKDELPPNFHNKKATVTRPSIALRYGEQLQLELQLPPRHSDKLAKLATTYFDENRLWHGQGNYTDLIHDVEAVPEDVIFPSDALEFIDREVERAAMLVREQQWLHELDAGTLELDLLRVPLYDYQIRGALFLACRGRSILGDDMGLGKTVQTLAAIELLAQERGVQRIVVVAPASVKYQWEAEITRFTNRPVQVIEGSPDDRRNQYSKATFYRLVNYEQVVRDRDAINAWRPDIVVLDEAQRIKNWEAKTSREVKKLQSRYAIVLTGTPLENKLEELYSIVQFVDERRFGPAFQFLHEHRMEDADGNLMGYRNLDKIREKLEPIFLRRTRAEVLTQLPTRTDNTVVVELAPEQRVPYEEQRVALARLLQKNYLTDLDRKRILACLVNLRMICDSLYLFDHENRVSPKLNEFAELIPEVTGDDHKAVVFSQWEVMIAEAAKVLEALGVGFAVLHGGLSGLARKEVLERFKTDPNCKVFLSTDAGGTGLNLQAADTVMNLELPWNPAVLEQRIARVHRMGQSRPVRVINFVTRGTIEVKVLRTLQAKQELFTSLFEGNADEMPFEAAKSTTFLDTMRELVDEEPGEAVLEAADGKRPTALPSTTAGSATLWQGMAQFLEAAVASLSDSRQLAELPGELRAQLRAAALNLANRFDTEPPRHPES